MLNRREELLTRQPTLGSQVKLRAHLSRQLPRTTKGVDQFLKEHALVNGALVGQEPLDPIHQPLLVLCPAQTHAQAYKNTDLLTGYRLPRYLYANVRTHFRQASRP